MKKSIIFMFSGQGSQYYHMGKELYLNYPTFKKWMDYLDSEAVAFMGESILYQLYNEKYTISDPLIQLKYSHPAIFMVEFSLGKLLEQLKIVPDVVLGSSLGEFASAAISGSISPENALKMVIRQAEAIENSCSNKDGGMMTILYSPSLYNQIPLMQNYTELAAINYHSHFVISGKIQKLIEIEKILENQDITFQMLPVAYAFHSSMIEPVGPSYLSYLKKKKYLPPKCKFFSGMTGIELKEIPVDYFWQIVRNSMKFPTAIENLEKKQSYIYIDLGPSGTLSNFLKHNLKESSDSIHLPLMSPFGSDKKRVEQCFEFISAQNTFQIKKEKSKMKVFMFPGQGSQQKGMGENLFDEFNDLTEKADKILGYSLKELCLEDPNGKLMQTQFTQPAIYAINAFSYLKRIQKESKPDFVLGHSVAEFNALFASGVVDFETGLKLVKKRGELMAEAKEGGMAAVMGLPAEKIQKILDDNNFQNLYIANLNSSFQLVISGSKEEIKNAEPDFLKNGATHYRILNVSGAFHTPYMEEAGDKFKKFVKKIKFGNITIPIISNVTARPYKNNQIKENIFEQITSPVKWMESIQYLLAQGIDINDFYEISGIGLSVVKALAMRINNEAGPLDLSEEEKKAEIETPENKTKAKQTQTVGNKKPTITKPIPPIREMKNSAPSGNGNGKITVHSLGDDGFKKEYGLKYPYLCGGMYKGIASKEMVVKMGKAGMMAFYGTGGLELTEIESSIRFIQNELNNGQPYGMNLVSNPMNSDSEEQIIRLFIKYNIHTIEAAAFLTITPPLVQYRAAGLKKNVNGTITNNNKIIAKVSRPEVAEQFLSPAPERILSKLLQAGKISEEQAEMLKKSPIADDLIIEADSGGHTDQGMPYALMPAMLKLRDEMIKKFNYSKPIRLGAAGGIGTPEAAAAAFILGADFILTGSINQCTVEARTSDQVKDLLQQINVQDTDYAPAGDLFELGAKVQVLKRGVFFPARANKLYELYRQFDSIESIDITTKKQLQERYFKRSFQDIYQDVSAFYPAPEIEKAEQNPKYKMALIFRWYFGYSTRLALAGDESDKVNYQVPCGPSLGAFNQWVKGTSLEDWRKRHVDEIGIQIIQETAEILNQRLSKLQN